MSADLICSECGHRRLNPAQASACCTMQGSPCPDCHDARLREFVAEAREHGLAASIEHPGYVALHDQAGRVLHIGDANGPWGVDVHACETDWLAGSQPAESEDLQGDTVRLMFHHALCIAARVPVSNPSVPTNR